MITLYFCLIILKCAFSLNKVTVLFVNEELNDVAEKSVEVVLNYIKRNPQLGVDLEVHNVVAHKDEGSSFLSSLCSIYKQMINSQTPPHLVFDTTKLGYASETVKYFTASLGLPTVSTSFGEPDDLRYWKNLNQEQVTYLIHIKPPTDMLTDIVRPMVIHQKIPNAAIFHDDTFVLKHKYKSLLMNFATRHAIAYVEKSTIHDQLLNSRKLDIANFFILGNFSTVQTVLEAACETGLLTRRSAFHVISTTRLNITFNCPKARFLITRPKLDNKEQEKMEMLKKDYNLTVRPEIMAAFYFDLLIHTAVAIKNMQQTGVWPSNMSYVTCDDYNFSNTPSRPGLNLRKYFDNDIPNTPIYGNFVFDQNGQNALQYSVDILGVEIVDNVVSSAEILATWETGHEYNFTVYNTSEMKTYINEKFFTVVTVEQKPFIYIDKHAPRGFRGYCIDLMDDIAKICNFDYDIRLSSDGTWGSLSSKGKWTGGISDIVDQRVELGLGALSVLAEREEVVDFSIPFYDPVGFAILMKQTGDTGGVFKFLTVLEGDVWICILIAFISTSLLMYIFDKMSPFSFQNNPITHPVTLESRVFNFFECVWFVTTSLTPQGGGEAPKCLSGRLLAATWWLFGFIIIASYTANLAAFLTVSRLDTSIQSLDDLANQYQISYAPINGSQAMIYFQRMAEIEQKFLQIWEEMSLNDSLGISRSRYSVWEYPISSKFTKLWFSMQQFGLPTNSAIALERVRSDASDFAFVGDASDLKYFRLINCDLQVVGEEFSRKPYAIAIQKGHPLKEQVDNAILTLVNRRRLTQLKDKWWSQNPEAALCAPEEIVGISIQNIAGVFIVVLIGTSLSIIFLICNKFKTYIQQRK